MRTWMVETLQPQGGTLKSFPNPQSPEARGESYKELPRGSQLLAHDIAWYKRAANPSDPFHSTVHNHEWLLQAIVNKVKEIETKGNAGAMAAVTGHELMPVMPHRLHSREKLDRLYPSLEVPPEAALVQRMLGRVGVDESVQPANIMLAGFGVLT